MKKRKHIFVLFFFIFGVSVPYVAGANVSVTEVMYNPAGSDAGNEWIELYNNGTEDVEMSAGQKGWKVNDGSNHVLASPVSLPPGQFVVVTNNPTGFTARYGSATPVVKSAIHLNNTSGIISLLNASGEIVESVSYSKSLGAFEDSMSLHRVGDTFAPGVPGPGLPPNPGVPTKASAQKQIIAVVQKPQTPRAVQQEQPKHLTPEVVNQKALPAAVVEAKEGGSFLWHYVAGLVALLIFGVASVWYVRLGQERRPETAGLADEFDIE